MPGSAEWPWVPSNATWTYDLLGSRGASAHSLTSPYALRTGILADTTKIRASGRSCRAAILWPAQNGLPRKAIVLQSCLCAACSAASIVSYPQRETIRVRQGIPPYKSSATVRPDMGALAVGRALVRVLHRTMEDRCVRACNRRRGLHVATALVAITVLLVTGCVQRRMTIRSNPPGALVYIDDYYIGTTPVSTDFTYYGKRKIRLVKDGYEILTVPKYNIPPTWYEVFPIEFVSENIIPWEIRDERSLDFQLAPQVVVPQDQLLGRAEQLRSQTQLRGGPIAAPAGVVVPGNVPGGPTYIPPGPITPQPLPQPRYPIQPPATQPLLAPPPVGVAPPLYPLTPPSRNLPLPGRY